MVEHAEVQSADVFVDVGSGLGRAAALTHFLTGASVIGLEIQSALVRFSRYFTKSLNASRISVVEGDAAQLTGYIMIGSVFFLYCPFSGDRLEKVLNDLEAIAQTRPIRVCCVDLPLPPRPWLTPVSPRFGDLAIYRSLQP
jgi:precorrin-6B methylase 2